MLSKNQISACTTDLKLRCVARKASAQEPRTIFWLLKFGEFTWTSLFPINYSMAHELRSPMTATGNCGILESSLVRRKGVPRTFFYCEHQNATRKHTSISFKLVKTWQESQVWCTRFRRTWGRLQNTSRSNGVKRFIRPIVAFRDRAQKLVWMKSPRCSYIERKEQIQRVKSYLTIIYGNLKLVPDKLCFYRIE